MTSLFASQFGTATPYSPVRLDTGTLSVGANLPRLSKPSVPAKVPAKVPSAVAPGAALGLAAGAGESASASKSANANVSVPANIRNAAISKSMTLGAQADANAAIPANGVSSPLTKKTSGASISIPSPEWGIKQTKQAPNLFNQTATSPHTLATPAQDIASEQAPATSQTRGGFLGSIENWGSSLTNQWDHAMYSPNTGAKPVDAYEQAAYNRTNGAGSRYFNPGATSAAAMSGGVQGLSSGTNINKTTDSGVTEPSNVWNPTGNGSALYTKPSSSSVPSSGTPYSLQFQQARAALPAQSATAKADLAQWESELSQEAEASASEYSQIDQAELKAEEEAMAA